MEDELPNEFDLVVIGTGFPESVIAAAASRIGKTVLHLDPNEFYGGTWASFNLDSFQNFIENNSKLNFNENSDEKSLKITENSCGIINAKQEWHIKDEEKPIDSNETLSATTPTQLETATEAIDTIINNDTSTNKTTITSDKNEILTKEQILKQFRKFNIDLIPKILYGSGKLVNLLITSNICRYAEFRAIDHICTLFNNEIKNVPCSRNDVFNTNDLTIIEKRLLMKLLTNCMNYKNSKNKNEKNLEQSEEKGKEVSNKSDDTNFHEYEGKTFLEYLKGQKLTDKIIHCVLYAISMCNEKTSLNDGIENIKKFLNSLGRYGNTPFLFPMYGCGEIPQDFCRLSAVFGGIYCLKRSIDDLKISDNHEKIDEIKFNNQNIKIGNLIIGNNNIPNGLLSLFTKKDENESIPLVSSYCGNISRAIFITSTPIGNAELNSGGGGVNIMRLPGLEEGTNGAFIIQLSHYSGTCPKGLYLIHITVQSKSNSAGNDLKPYIEQIFKENDLNSSKILYSAYYQISSCKKCLKSKTNFQLQLSNVYLTCGPYNEFDYDKSIENAYEIFKKIYPNDEFLPRAPDPEEIIIGDEDPTYIEGEEASEITELNEQMNKSSITEDSNENVGKCTEENIKNEEKET